MAEHLWQKCPVEDIGRACAHVDGRMVYAQWVVRSRAEPAIPAQVAHMNKHSDVGEREVPMCDEYGRAG